MIATGERLRSQSGRWLAPAPRINLGSDRATEATIRRIRVWLLDEARAEAQSRRDDWAATLLKGCEVRNLSPSDMDTLNYVLFGDVDGPGPEHRETPHPSLF